MAKKTAELKIIIADIETYKEVFLCGGYIPHEDRWVMWEISARKNQVDGMVKFLLEYPIDYYCMFNGAGFDSQVLQYIIDCYERWYNLTGLEVVELIYNFAQELISNQNYENIKLPYREEYMDIKQIDMFLILHMNNQNRRTSLKWCEFSMDSDIEELPIEHWKQGLTSDDIEKVISYWKNDIRETHRLYNYCIGNTEHKDYQGKDKIQLRIDLIEEMGLPTTAINWNDVKIGAELNKKNYLELSNISNQKLWDKVKNRKTKTGFKFKDCYPEYTKFETKEFQEFFKRVGSTQINLNVKQEFPFTYNGTTYTFAKGGGHSCEKARMIKPEGNQILIDGDVGSMYPNIIRKRGLYPSHLGPKWNEAYISNIGKRLHAKKQYKETGEKKWDNLQETYKLVLNGNFGRLIDRHDYQYDPFCGMQVTVGGQIDIFMLMEDLEVAGHHVISMNTDGLTVLTERDKLDDYYRICKEWEQQVGNDTMGNLEYVEYTLLVQTSVNDYLAIKADGGVKKKGDFLTSYELHKNKSCSIVPMALEVYYTKGVPVEDAITNYHSIWPFCIAKKASKDYYYRGINRKTGEQQDYNKLVRYYCTTKGEKLYKIKRDTSDKPGPKISQCESTSNHQQIFNKPEILSDIKDYNIDYKWYISQAKKLIWQIDPVIKRDDKEAAQGKLLLF